MSTTGDARRTARRPLGHPQDRRAHRDAELPQPAWRTGARGYLQGPLRVLMVTPRFAPEIGGVEHHVQEVASRAAASGCDVTVLTTDRSRRLPAAETRDGFTIRRVPAWPGERDWQVAPGLVRAITGGDRDVLHVQSYHTFVAPLAMAAARAAGLPYVVTFHGGGHSSAARHSIRTVQRKVLGPLLRSASALVAIADFEVAEYGAELGLDADRFVMVPNGIDLVDEATLPALGPQEGTLIASIGRLERYKGHHRVIAALPHIAAQRPDVRLWIAGDGPYEPELRALAAQLGVADRVTFEAVRDRRLMLARVQATDLVALLSDFETHPIAVLEAVGLRRRVLVADNSGLSEVARRGLARAIPTEAAPRDAARAALELLDAPAPAAPVDLPSWDDCADALVELYRTVAKVPATVATPA